MMSPWMRRQHRACALTGSISGEATNPLGNICREAVRTTIFERDIRPFLAPGGSHHGCQSCALAVAAGGLGLAPQTPATATGSEPASAVAVTGRRRSRLGLRLHVRFLRQWPAALVPHRRGRGHSRKPSHRRPGRHRGSAAALQRRTPAFEHRLLDLARIQAAPSTPSRPSRPSHSREMIGSK